MYTHVKIQLFKKGTKYFGKIIPALIQKKEFEYQITKEGLMNAS